MKDTNDDYCFKHLEFFQFYFDEFFQFYFDEESLIRDELALPVAAKCLQVLNSHVGYQTTHRGNT